MDGQFVAVATVAMVVATYVAAESHVRQARRRDAVQRRRARHGGPSIPAPRREVDLPDEKEQERHDPRPVGTP